MTPFDNRSPATHPRLSYSGFLLLGVALMMIIACVVSLFASPLLQSLLVSSPPTPSPTVPLAALPPLDLNHSALSSVAMVSSDDGWVVGKNRGNLLALDLHAPQNGWAVGFMFCGATTPALTVCDQRVAIYHYDGAEWTPTATEAHGTLNAVAAFSADDVWAVGEGINKSGPSSLILHYHSGQWQQYPTPFAIGLNALSMTSTTEGWAVGYAQLADKTSIAPGLLHYRNGIWTQATLG